MIYSGWKFILFLVFGSMTSNFLKSIQVTILIKITEEYETESAFLKNKNFVFVTFRLPEVN